MSSNFSLNILALLRTIDDSIDMKHLVLSLTLAIAAFAIAFVAISEYQYREEQREVDLNKPYAAKMIGEYVCLPRIREEESGACEYGFKTEAGKYYALDPKSVYRAGLKLNDRFLVSGLITPRHLLTASYWEQFPIHGFLTITEPVRIR